MGPDKTDKTDKSPAKARELQGHTRKPRSKRADRKPAPDMEAIRALNEFLDADREAKFIFELH